jgi:hypothetical protein
MTACSSKPVIDEAASVDFLSGPRPGLLAGASIGDPWSSVRQGRPEAVTVVESDARNLGMEYLLYLHDDGDRTIRVDFSVDDAQRVSSISARIGGTGENRARAAAVAAQVIGRLDAKYGAARCDPECTWQDGATTLSSRTFENETAYELTLTARAN